jgi:hypothetical protein
LAIGTVGRENFFGRQSALAARQKNAYIFRPSPSEAAAWRPGYSAFFKVELPWESYDFAGALLFWPASWRAVATPPAAWIAALSKRGFG